MKKKKVSVDFRYNTGQARVPWAAVGETVQAEEIVDIVLSDIL